MDGTKAARCKGDVRKLAHFFESLGTSSPEKIINRKGSAGSGTRCNECSELHPPCNICYKVHHSYRCPYFDHLPRGAPFDPGYKIVCDCGNAFNVDRWACTFCGGGGPVLTHKYCSFCNVFNDHDVYDC